MFYYPTKMFNKVLAVRKHVVEIERCLTKRMACREKKAIKTRMRRLNIKS